MLAPSLTTPILIFGVLLYDTTHALSLHFMVSRIVSLKLYKQSMSFVTLRKRNLGALLSSLSASDIVTLWKKTRPTLNETKLEHQLHKQQVHSQAEWQGALIVTITLHGCMFEPAVPSTPDIPEETSTACIELQQIT